MNVESMMLCLDSWKLLIGWRRPPPFLIEWARARDENGGWKRE